MKKILAATLGDCVHVAGINNFLNLCKSFGYKTIFLGTRVPIETIKDYIRKEKPDFVALSYRLNSETFSKILTQIRNLSLHKESRLIFGGTPDVAFLAKRSGLFVKSFDGTESIEEIQSFISGKRIKSSIKKHSLNLRERLLEKRPLIRHHYGRPSLKETLGGLQKIALSGVCDIISIGPDQNTQQFFFKPEKRDSSKDGAGGVPLKNLKDFIKIYKVTRRGNFPLLRCYAGTEDLLKWAKMLHKTIHNAWGAIPLCWYSRLDGRSDRPLYSAIVENQEVIRWHAKNNIPVEINEPHQWSLRQAHDSLTVFMAFLAAFIAKELKVKDYICQYMFNTPPGLSPVMDLAKMLAQKEIVESLSSSSFRIYTMVRAGLKSLSGDFAVAKGELSSSTVLSMALNPDIVHVVGFSEADHAITADELIESCKIVRGVISKTSVDYPDLTLDPRVQKRKKEILKDVNLILKTFDSIGKRTSPRTLFNAIKVGLIDAPDLAGNCEACGKIKTKIIDGACRPVSNKGILLSEKERIKQLKIDTKKL